MCEGTFGLVVDVGIDEWGGGECKLNVFKNTHRLCSTGQWINFPAYVMERMARLGDRIE